MSKKRFLSGAAAVAVLIGSVMVGPAAQAASTTGHGPYKTLADCKFARAIMAPHVDRVGECYPMPKRGYFFTAYRY